MTQPYDSITPEELRSGENDYEIKSLRQQLAQAQAACAEYRAAISELLRVAPHEFEGSPRAMACFNANSLLRSQTIGKERDELIDLRKDLLDRLQKSESALKQAILLLCDGPKGHHWYEKVNAFIAEQKEKK